MGIRFRRQHPVGSDYRVDFFCSSAQLVIEVDGAVHDGADAERRDRLREDYLRSCGLDVIRVAARDVLANADEVAASIVSLAARPLHHRASRDGPPPRAGEDQ
jgi:very-short-patch-repair endonuclease